MTDSPTPTTGPIAPDESTGPSIRRREFIGKTLAVAGTLAGLGAAACTPSTSENADDNSTPTTTARRRIVILGAGFGGLETATTLGEQLDPARYEVTLIDRNEGFFVGFSKFDVMFRRKTRDEVTYRYADLLAKHTTFVRDTITKIDVDERVITTAGGSYPYDYLVVALGAELANDAMPGFVESGAHEFYSMDGAARLGDTIRAFTSGTLVSCVFRGPYKCPPAPYEGMTQLHDHFVKAGVRDDITMKIVIPSPIPLPVSPQASGEIQRLLTECNIELVSNTKIARVDAAAKQLVAADDTRFDYDLLVGVPVHVPPAPVRESKLAPEGFIPVAADTLLTAFPDVYAIGDVCHVTVGKGMVPKTGAFAEQAGRTVATHILSREGIIETVTPYLAKGVCYFEVGGGTIARVNGNFLEGEKPVVTMDGFNEDLRAEKAAFTTSRRDRWFRSH